MRVTQPLAISTTSIAPSGSMTGPSGKARPEATSVKRDVMACPLTGSHMGEKGTGEKGTPPFSWLLERKGSVPFFSQKGSVLFFPFFFVAPDLERDRAVAGGQSRRRERVF